MCVRACACLRVCACVCTRAYRFIDSGGSSCDDSLTGELGRPRELSSLAN